MNDIYVFGPDMWALAFFCAAIVGMSKAGVPGLGTLAVPLMAMVFPPSLSTGILLPILVAGDSFGVFYFHRSADWKVLLRLMPAALLGIISGFFLMRMLLQQEHVNDIIRISIGGVVLLMVVLTLLKEKLHLKELSELPPRATIVVAACFGILAGITTMMANAAGPITLMYLLAMRLPKNVFIGTGAWYFAILNWCKVPFMTGLGLINGDSLLFNLKLLPAVFVGSLIGVQVSKKLSNGAFEKLVLLLTAVSALKLLIS